LKIKFFYRPNIADLGPHNDGVPGSNPGVATTYFKSPLSCGLFYLLSLYFEILLQAFILGLFSVE
jgi:hypothetical protein